MRFVRPLVIAVLVLLMAVTPLSALIAPGEFEVRFGPDGRSRPWLELSDFGFTVHLADRTGLVKGLAAVAPSAGLRDVITNHGVDGKVLILELDGSSCDYRTHLTFERAVQGFLMRARTDGFSCGIGTGMSRTVAIHLWMPVDASTVILESD